MNVSGLTKKALLALGLFVLAIFMATMDMHVPNPFKITDPANSEFEVSKFDFKDYGTNHKELLNALNLLFPHGTSKSYVDKILLDEVGASYRKSNTGAHVYRADAVKKLIRLSSRSCDTWTIRIEYNENDKLKDLVLLPLCF